VCCADGEDLVTAADTHLYPNYGPRSVVLERGEGSFVWDSDGRRYTDLYAGIAVSVLGHAHPVLTRAICEQAGRLLHQTNYFLTVPNVRLAERRGVVVAEGDASDLRAWYELYLQTTARHGLEPMSFEHAEAMLRERAEGAASPVVTQLLLARHDGRLLAGMLLALAPDRATYLYGASSREHRELMGSYALQWAAIRAAKAHGCRDYDLLGAAPRDDAHHALAGVHRFKAGFGGQLLHREGCWDFPFDDGTYQEWRAHEQAALARRALA
jgi:lipid II:glycine glycyltransferase (peptidoglycan interpeptide bridge formation enzyme)